MDAAPRIGFMNSDLQWMQEAIELAKEAGEAGEVPVGAVVVRDGILVGRGRNVSVGTTDPTQKPACSICLWFWLSNWARSKTRACKLIGLNVNRVFKRFNWL